MFSAIFGLGESSPVSGSALSPSADSNSLAYYAKDSNDANGGKNVRRGRTAMVEKWNGRRAGSADTISTAVSSMYSRSRSSMSHTSSRGRSHSGSRSNYSTASESGYMSSGTGTSDTVSTRSSITNASWDNGVGSNHYYYEKYRTERKKQKRAVRDLEFELEMRADRVKELEETLDEVERKADFNLGDVKCQLQQKLVENERLDEKLSKAEDARKKAEHEAKLFSEKLAAMVREREVEAAKWRAAQEELELERKRIAEEAARIALEEQSRLARIQCDSDERVEREGIAADATTESSELYVMWRECVQRDSLSTDASVELDALQKRAEEDLSGIKARAVSRPTRVSHANVMNSAQDRTFVNALLRQRHPTSRSIEETECFHPCGVM